MKTLVGFFVVVIIGLVILVVDESANSDQRIYEQLKSEILADVQTDVNSPEESSVEKEWVKIKTWTGTGMKNTETFTIQNSEWRIIWKTSKEAFPGAGILQAFLNTSSGEMKELPINQLGVGSGDTVIRGAGSYYLEISSANMTWEISLFDYREKD